jgi:predicted glycogen debranching enzyme
LVRRGAGKTIVAGYPWFTDWGRDTFIALRGLCVATGRLDDARDILMDWAGMVSEGMLPNRFPDGGGVPEYNSVDASLWYIVAVHDYLQAAGNNVPLNVRDRLRQTVEAILTGYAAGTRYGIRRDGDGLLAAGVPGVQLTWTDAKVGDWVVTPRIGKPVEVQALWLNALRIGASLSTKPLATQWSAWYARGLDSFRARFWNESGGYLYDVVDPDHQPGAVDATLRPNQIFAVGGLPYPLLDNEPGRRVVDAVEARLLTPLGLRSLAPGSPGYAPRYEGGVLERDGAYHEGTVWPWLMGPFVEAWLRVRGNTPQAKREAKERFLAPLLRHLDEGGLGHVSEIADGDPPHTPRGTPFQAWSLGELLRVLMPLTDS